MTSVGPIRQVLSNPYSSELSAPQMFDRQVRAFGKAGQHALRQLRIAIVGLGGTGSIVAQQLAHLGVPTWLRKNRTPEDLIRFWLGHADETFTDGYSKLREDVEYRKEVAAEVGLGFEILAQKPVVVPNVPNFAVFAVQQNVA